MTYAEIQDGSDDTLYLIVYADNGQEFGCGTVHEINGMADEQTMDPEAYRYEVLL